MTNFFKKDPKRTYFGAFWAIFTQIWAKMNFPGKKELSVFRNFNYLSLCQKLDKTIEQFLRKTRN